MQFSNKFEESVRSQLKPKFRAKNACTCSDNSKQIQLKAEFVCVEQQHFLLLFLLKGTHIQIKWGTEEFFSLTQWWNLFQTGLGLYYYCNYYYYFRAVHHSPFLCFVTLCGLISICKKKKSCRVGKMATDITIFIPISLREFMKKKRTSFSQPLNVNSGKKNDWLGRGHVQNGLTTVAKGNRKVL